MSDEEWWLVGHEYKLGLPQNHYRLLLIRACHLIAGVVQHVFELVNMLQIC